MARLFIDGYEADDLTLWDTVGSATLAAAQTGMSGNYSLKLSPLGYVQRALPSGAEIYFALKYMPTDSVSAPHAILTLYHGSSPICRLDISTTTAILRARRASDILASGTTSLSLNTTYLIEGYIKVSDTVGRFVVDLNGVNQIDYTGDTNESAYSTYDIIRLGWYDSGTFGYAYIDDLVLDDAGWIGDTKIQGIRPTAVGNSAEWTPSAGANWECVDEVPADDGNWNEINANDKLDLFGMTDLTGNIEVIKCMQAQARTKKEGTPTPQNLKLALRTASTNYVSADKVVQTSYKPLFNIWEVNPNTSAAWIVSQVNGLEAGVKSAA